MRDYPKLTHVVYLIMLLIFALLILQAVCSAEDEIIKALKFIYHAGAFLDYQTTLQASYFPEFDEGNKLTRFYWRSPPAFCLFKAIETYALDSLFEFVYKKSKVLGVITVIGFAIVRIIAYKDNLKIIGGIK